MNSLLQLLFLGAFGFSFTQASNNTYIHPLRGADFIQCKDSILKNATIPSNPNFTPVFVDAHGNIVPRHQNCSVDIDYPCGVDYNTCVNYCGYGRTPPKWSTFSPQFTAWLLPFIALTAQLPYQTTTTWDNLMSALLMVGSPALAAYSLILSFFGTRWLRKHCAWPTDFIPRKAKEQIPGNTNEQKRQKLKSLFGHMNEVLCLAQQEPYENLNFAPLAPGDLDAEADWWEKLNTIVQKTKRGYTASFIHQLLWVNIAFAFAIVDAFESERIGNNATAYGLAISLIWQWETPVVMGWVLVGISGVETAIRSAIVELHDDRSLFEDYNTTIQRCKPIGDRAQPGPIFNYARVFIWRQRAQLIINRYRQEPLPENHFRSTSFKHIIYSFCLALALQWSTGGASILISYLTPTVGLSCRSGGYLIYTVNSTIILFLLIVCSFLSDLFILEPEEHLVKSYYGWTAVALRTLAKTIAVINSVWIFLHCVFEFTSFYNNCWCNSIYAVMGQKGYWIWLSNAQQKELWDIRAIWSGCSALGITVPSLFVLCFLVAHHHYHL